jgi:transposase InsO family protein
MLYLQWEVSRMPWQEVTRMESREEFVKLAMQAGANRRELCRRFKIAPKTGYKWLLRYAEQGSGGLIDRSRQPRRSPQRTAADIEQRVIKMRCAVLGSWGGRKLARRLVIEGGPKLAPSTITGILRRGGLLNRAAPAPRPFQRFERPVPNELWQMDFKGNFATIRAPIRCHPLTVLDDHSRFSLVLKACADEREQTVRSVLTEAFRRYGLPAAMLMDNGSPWGAAGAQPFTGFSLWLIRLGIRVAHGRPYHPQTQGKDERFHRTLKFEVLRHFNFTSLEHCQREFDSFRDRYNLVRPHDALGLATPVSRYRPSPIPFPESLPPVEYPPGLEVRKVQAEGWFSYRGKAFRVSKALRGFPIALRQSELGDSLREVLFCHQLFNTIDLDCPQLNQ